MLLALPPRRRNAASAASTSPRAAKTRKMSTWSLVSRSAPAYFGSIAAARSGAPASSAALMRQEYTTLSWGTRSPKASCAERQVPKCFLLDSILSVVCQKPSVTGAPERLMSDSMRSTTSSFPTRTAD